MATTSGSSALASDFNSIRTRVIAEFNTSSRRNIGTNYKTPAAAQSAGNTMNAANVNNIAKNLYYVNSSTYTSNGINAGTKISIVAINTALTTYEGKAKQGNSSGCGSGCIGLCQGCVGGCQGGCYTACAEACSVSCIGGCSNSCAGTGCSGNCYGSCVGGTS